MDEDVLRHDDPRWRLLLSIIRERSVQIGNFTLTSGANSNLLFNLRQTTMHRVGAIIVADIVLQYMQHHGIHCLGGPVQGSVPIGQSVLMLGYTKGYPVHHFFTQGHDVRIAGYPLDQSEVLIVDDVATKGGSITGAIKSLQVEHPSCQVRRALVIVDRQEGAKEMLLSKYNVQLVSIFKKSDFTISD